MKRRGFINALFLSALTFFSAFTKKIARSEGFFDDIWKKLGGTSAGRRENASNVIIKRNAEVVICRREEFGKTAGIKKNLLLQNMFQDSVRSLFKVSDYRDALNALFAEDDVIGIKVNCLAGKGLSSNIQLVNAIIKSLNESGISDRQIIIWDRTDKDLIRAGYEISRRRNGLRCFGTNKDYENEISFSGEVGSCFSKILTRECTALINVPVLKDHDLAGVSIGMKNFYGAIHNPNKYHDDACNPFVAHLNLHPQIRDKLKLTVCDALTAQYHGGPAYSPSYTWSFNGILLATDAVALDSTGLKIIEDKRREKGMKTFKEEKREPLYIKTAQESGLGTYDREKIKVKVA